MDANAVKNINERMSGWMRDRYKERNKNKQWERRKDEIKNCLPKMEEWIDETKKINT